MLERRPESVKNPDKTVKEAKRASQAIPSAPPQSAEVWNEYDRLLVADLHSFKWKPR